MGGIFGGGGGSGGFNPRSQNVHGDYRLDDGKTASELGITDWQKFDDYNAQLKAQLDEANKQREQYLATGKGRAANVLTNRTSTYDPALGLDSATLLTGDTSSIRKGSVL